MTAESSTRDVVGNTDVADRLARLPPAQRALLERKLKEKAQLGGSDQAIPKRSGEGPAPLSFAQQRLWFLDQFEPGSGFYNIPLALQLDGALDLAALRASLSDVVRRHQALRTTFVANQGEPLQIVRPAIPVALPVRDLSGLAQAARDREFAKLKREEANAPFDLATGPLLRASLIRLGEFEHVLLITVHHIVSDGWSLSVLRREIAVLYSDYQAGRAPSLPELPIQYADYAVWQRQSLRGSELEKQLAYWKAQLAGAPPLLELPTDRPRPAQQAFRGARCLHMLPKSLCTAVREIAQGERATLFMAMLAAFQALLRRYTRNDDIVVGSPIAGRNRAETEDLIGFFVSTLALRTDLSGNPSFRELLARVREVALNAFAHQDLPFEKLVEELKPARSLSYPPLIQVMFALQNLPRAAAEPSGLSVRKLEYSSDTSKFDLSLFVTERDSGIELRAEYNTDLFDGATIARLLSHYQILLEGVVANPDQRIGELPLLSAAERRQLLRDWNRTAAVYPRVSVHRLLEARTEQAPDEIALVFGRERMSYRELNDRANRVARHLVSLRVAPGSLVGICMERSAAMIVGLLGILKAGGAYVPLDPAYPKERLAFMLDDTQARVLLSEERLLDSLPDHRATLLCLDRDWSEIAEQSGANLAAVSAPEDLAYVIYTSGSTGTPKGVCVPHCAIVRLLCNTDYIAIDATDRIAQASNASFDAATFEIWGALLNGAQLIGVSKDVVLSPADFAAQLDADNVTTLFLTTALFNLMAREFPKAFGKVRHLLFGGEQADPRCVRQVLRVAPPQRLLHVYGPTETTTFSTWYQVKSVAENAATVPIGRPIANSEAYVLDEHLKPVPIGVAGELYVGGDGLARGYLNRADLTAAKFVANPFADATAARLYRTGDRVRYLADGNIEFVARIDNQVKIRGFRIELGEIETVLSQHPQVKEAVVTVREDAPGDKRLVAYIVGQTNSSGPAVSKEGPASEAGAEFVQALREFLKQKLPDYMLPSALVVLDRLPITPNGKLDRKALPAPDAAEVGAHVAFIAPRTPLEQKLANIFAQVLNTDRVGIHDNFFDLGGHSLLVVRLIAEIEKQLGRRLSVASLFQSPAISRIAEVLQAGDAVDIRQLLVPINPHGTTPPLFHVYIGVAADLRKFGAYLGARQCFYGFSSQCCDPDRVPLTSIEEMAACYLSELRAVQPHGPYFLSGHCVAGLIALEMAQQLRASGERVAMLVLMDAPTPIAVIKRERGGYPDLERHLRNFAPLTLGQKLGYVAVRLADRVKETAYRIAFRVYRRLGLQQPHQVWARYILDVHVSARKKYSPRAYPDKVSFIWGTIDADPVQRAKYESAWSWLMPNTEHYLAPFEHERMFYEPHVKVVAEQMKHLLSEAQAAHSREPSADSVRFASAPSRPDRAMAEPA